MTRTIHFHKIQNARDLGGLQTAGGRTISPGLLIRSANLSEATAGDLDVLRNQYRLAKIIDLRTGTERGERPDRLIDGVDYLPLPVFDERMVGISHEKSQRDEQEQNLSSLPDMAQLYIKMVTEESCRRNLGRAARCVMEHDYSRGSVLWHCTEGKDRCGLLTMILLFSLGVDRAAILEDYLLTNEGNAPKAERYYQMLLSAGKTEAEADAVRNIFLARAEYLEEAFASIDEHYGDADTFLREGLNIPSETIQQFQETVLSPYHCLPGMPVP